MEKFFCESTLSASAQMSDFLERLKIGVVNIDNSIPPDSSGVITRKLQKKYVSDSFDTLGLELSEDAEILSVAKNSPAAVAQIPPYFMIYEVNDTYVGNRSAFKDVANGALNLVIKLQSVAGMTELISKILQDEDHQMDGPSNQSLKLGELLETTPRFNFLSHEHPLFLRYKERLSKERLAISLIRQRTKEAEDEQMRVVRERIEKAALEVQTASEAAAKPPATSPPPIEKTPEPAPNGAEPFFEVFESDNIFSVDANVDAVKKPATPPSEPLEKVSNTELLALVVGSPLEAVSGSSALSISKPPPVDDNNDDGEVHFAILPSEEYSLLNGEKVIMSLIKRRGPLPAPPPGLPPITISTSSRADTAAAHRSEEMPRSPPKTDAASAKKTSPSRSVERHDQHDNSHSDKHRSKRYRRERTPERKRSKSRYY